MAGIFTYINSFDFWVLFDTVSPIIEVVVSVFFLWKTRNKSENKSFQNFDFFWPDTFFFQLGLVGFPVSRQIQASK